MRRDKKMTFAQLSKQHLTCFIHVILRVIEKNAFKIHDFFSLIKLLSFTEVSSIFLCSPVHDSYSHYAIFINAQMSTYYLKNEHGV